MKINLGKVRRGENRCENRKVETNGRRRSWRCQLENGHGGDHISLSGHRRWADATAPEAVS